MPTYAQLRAEPWWDQEVVTDELDWLVDNLCAFYGVPRSNGGTKGNNLHLNGGHRSQRWIQNSRYCTNRTYTVQPGLTTNLNDIAAFDITLPPSNMLHISRNANACTRSGQLEELVEWFGNVDGDQRVDGWDNIRNRIASSDSSHLWHLHGRIRRDLLRRMDVMRKIYLALTTGTVTAQAEERDMETITIAKANDTGQLYACNGMWSRPITESAIPHLRTLATEGRIQLVGNGSVRTGWSAENYGELVGVSATPVDTGEVAEALAGNPAFVASVGQAFADAFVNKLTN